ncbi:MAG TPA: exodeoxyribonuclease I [Candidatus Binatia bacterium]|nr:exodeoxyribonuclease I [Candidatus Binatia bacterium]
MVTSFYFYDLETSGIDARSDRVMQFAGQRTDINLKSIGQPDNFLIKMTPDILPDPYAILITGITPQQTLADGMTEAEFMKYFLGKVATPNTTMIGYNNIRFDDEFMRFMAWRNFADAYEWQWKDGRSRWDLLDVVRMTRALRPEGIKWPFASDGKPSNRLELLSSINKLSHANAHDALSDVNAVIELAKLIKLKQPKLFDYLLNIRDKQKAGALVSSGEPFIYTSGRYSSENAHTTVAVKLAELPDKNGAVVYDLRINPAKFADMSAERLAQAWGTYGKDTPYFPAKALRYNRCPAVAPLSVLDSASQQRLNLDLTKIKSNRAALPKDFGDKLYKAAELMKKQTQPQMMVDPQSVDQSLYESFVSGPDKVKMSAIRAATGQSLAELHVEFNDERLQALLPLYKARNYPKFLDPDETAGWEKFRQQKLMSGGQSSALTKYFNKLDELAASSAVTDEQKYALEELRLYGESIAPID